MQYPFQYQCITSGCHAIKYSKKELKNESLYCVSCATKHFKKSLNLYDESSPANKKVRSKKSEAKNRELAKEKTRIKAAQKFKACLVCKAIFSGKDRHLSNKCCSDKCRKIRKRKAK